LPGLVELQHAPRGDVGHPEGVIAPSRPFEETEAAAEEYWLHQCHLISQSGRHMVPAPICVELEPVEMLRKDSKVLSTHQTSGRLTEMRVAVGAAGAYD
jgi:hypothetical protein